MKKIILIILVLGCINTLNAQQQSPTNVILIGIDGMMGEALRKAYVPNIDSIKQQGVISWNTRCVMPSLSAPNWAAILSGAGPEQTGVTDNDWTFEKHELAPVDKDAYGYFPSIYRVIRDQRRDAKTCLFTQWDWISKYINRFWVSKMEVVAGNQEITKKAVDYIVAQKPLFSFIQYDGVDEAGHQKGYMSEEYLKALTAVDTEIGKIVRALKNAGMYEQTLIVIVSDHGGKGKNHGGLSKEEMEVPWIAKGPGLHKNRVLKRPNDTMNTAMTIVLLLNLTPPDSWTGRPVYEAFDVQGPE